MMNEEQDSPNWSRTIKTIVGLTSAIFVILILYRFRSLLTSVVIGAILAYLLFPVVEYLHRKIRFRRNSIIVIVYALLAGAFISIFVYAGISIFQQVSNLISLAPAAIQSIPGRVAAFNAALNEPITILGYTFSLPEIEGLGIDWGTIANQLVGYVEPVLQQVGTSLTQIIFSTVGTLGNLVVILFISIYISIDAPQLSKWIGSVAEFPGYRYDAERLWRDFGRIWQAYLRGQAILALVIGGIVYVCLLVLGVENALVLALISGIMEFIPFIGPFIGAASAVIVAFFQDPTTIYFGMTQLQLAAVVLVVMIIIQQIENNFMVPRIVGDALDLNPLIVFVGALMGASLAGILGTILASPIIATIKLLGTYAWRKMFDLPPFPEPEEVAEDQPTWVENLWEQWQIRRATSGRSIAAEQEGENEQTGN